VLTTSFQGVDVLRPPNFFELMNMLNDLSDTNNKTSSDSQGDKESESLFIATASSYQSRGRIMTKADTRDIHEHGAPTSTTTCAATTSTLLPTLGSGIEGTSAVLPSDISAAARPDMLPHWDYVTGISTVGSNHDLHDSLGTLSKEQPHIFDRPADAVWKSSFCPFCLLSANFTGPAVDQAANQNSRGFAIEVSHRCIIYLASVVSACVSPTHSRLHFDLDVSHTNARELLQFR
jgi:hypothetical protein